MNEKDRFYIGDEDDIKLPLDGLTAFLGGQELRLEIGEVVGSRGHDADAEIEVSSLTRPGCTVFLPVKSHWQMGEKFDQVIFEGRLNPLRASAEWWPSDKSVAVYCIRHPWRPWTYDWEYYYLWGKVRSQNYYRLLLDGQITDKDTDFVELSVRNSEPHGQLADKLKKLAPVRRFEVREGTGGEWKPYAY